MSEPIKNAGDTKDYIDVEGVAVAVEVNKKKDILTRAGKTFVQAAVGYLCTITLADVDLNNKTAICGIGLSAIAAGLSALMNVDWTDLCTDFKIVKEKDNE